MKKTVLVLTATLFVPIEAQAFDWSGVYGELQSGYAFGDHILSYENGKYGLSHQFYTIGIEGEINAVTVGYRSDLFDSRWHVGVELSVLEGDVTGSKSFGNNWLDGRVTFSSEMVVSGSLMLGYALGEKTLVYGQLGKAATDLTLIGQVNESVNSLDFAENARGWVIGDFVAIGVSQKIRDTNWFWNAEIQYYDFNAVEDLKYKSHTLGNLEAVDKHMAVMVGLGYQF